MGLSSRESFHQCISQWLLQRDTGWIHLRALSIDGEDPWSLALDAGTEEMGAMKIRPASVADQPALKAFLESLSERSRFLFAPYPMDGRLDETLGRVLGASAQRRNLILHAWVGERIAAHAFLDGLDRLEPELGIAVAEDCQCKGLGRLMIALLQGCAAALERRAIALTTHPTNDRAFRLYQTMGFEQVGERMIRVADGSGRREREMVCPLMGGNAAVAGVSK